MAAEAEATDLAKTNAAIAVQHQALEEKPEEEVLAELDLPMPEEMKSGDDFSAFMKTSVPSALRNRALRTLWRSDPILANVDMLVDYGEDFTGKGDVIGAIKTAYQVGKGYLREEEPELEGDTVEAEEIEQTAEVEPEPEIEKAELPVIEAAKAEAPRRRMRFEFDSATAGTET